MDMCDDHPEEKLRFVCTVCDRLICRDCKLTEHEGHKTIDVAKATASLKEKLENHKDRLKGRLAVVENVAKEVEEDRQNAASVGDRLEADIHKRVALVTEWLQQVEAEAMESLRTTKIKIEANFSSTTSDLDTRCEGLQGMVEEVANMIKEMDSGQNASPIPALRLEQDMRRGRGSDENLAKLNEGLPLYSVRPYLRADKSCLTIDAIRMFIGSTVFTQVSKGTLNGSLKVAISPVFRCTSDKAARVTAVCPMPDGTVWVAHDVISDKDDEQFVALYSAKGKPIREQKIKGRVSIVRVARDWVFVGGEEVQNVMNIQETRPIVTERPDSLHVRKGGSLKHVKQPDAHCVFSKLDIRFSIKSSAETGRSVCAVEARNLPLLWIVCTSSTPIAVKSPLAMDVDSTGQYFAVVEGQENSVHMYKASQSEPVATYAPMGENFKPSDVCFHVLDGKEVLLISESSNNAIHVLDFRERLRFIGYLGAGCPLLVEPTALCKDEQDRLWIGCRGGQLLTCLDAEVLEDSSDGEEGIEVVHLV